MGELISFPHLGPAPRPTPVVEPVEAPAATAGRQSGPEPLWREVVGQQLRSARRTTERTLADVASDAGVSTQYLSEIERGLKEPSSEVLGAVAGALGLRLVDLTVRVSRSLATGAVQGPVCLAA